MEGNDDLETVPRKTWRNPRVYLQQAIAEKSITITIVDNMAKLSFRDSIVARIFASISIQTWIITVASIITWIIILCFYGFLIAMGLLLSGIIYLLYFIQDNLLYHPETPPNSRIIVPQPSIYKIPFEVAHIRSTNNVILHAYWMRHPGEKGSTVPTFIYLHGNAGNIGHRLSNAKGLFLRCGCNILMVDYRGYGLSTGKPSERGFYDDVRSTFNYLLARTDLDHKQICIFGRSLGGAVAIDISADVEFSQRIMCTIVENTFTSIRDMACHLLHRSFRHIPLFLHKNKFESVSKIAYFSAPCLFISGLADVLVPPTMMLRLYLLCGSTLKNILRLQGGTHNETWLRDGYYQRITSFLESCKENKGPLQTPPTRSNEDWSYVEEV